MTEAEFRALKPGDKVFWEPYGETKTVRSVELNRVNFEYPHGWDPLKHHDKYTKVGEQEAAHYRIEGVPEAWEVIEALQSSWPEDVRYHVGNVLKYVFRLGRKQGASVESDLEKIRNYADRAIKVLGKAGGK